MILNLHKTENQLFLLYFGGFYLGWFAWLARAEFLLAGFHNELQGLAFLCQSLCVGWIIKNYRSQRIPKLQFTSFKFLGFILFAIWISLVGAPLFSLAPTRFVGAMVTELSAFLFIISGLAFCFFSPKQRKLLILCFLPFILIAIVVSRTVDVGSLAATASRSDAFVQTGLWQRYALQMGIGSASAMLFLISISTIRSLVLSGALSLGVLLWLYSSLVYSKRQGLLELTLIGAFLGFYFLFGDRFKRIRIRLVLASLLVLTVVVGYIAQQGNLLILLERVYERFFVVKYDGLESFDRAAEAIYVFKSTSIVQYIMGRGLLSFDRSLVAFYNVHSGLINLMFKGGVFFPLFYMAALGSNVVLMLKHRDFPQRSVVIFFSVFMMIQMLYAPFWGFSANLFWMGFAYFSPEIFCAISRQQGERATRAVRPEQRYRRF